MRLPVPPLLVISDRRQARRPLEELAEAVFAGGCHWFSLREKDLPPAERRALLGALVALGHRWGATVTVHDDIDAAAMADADGVHLGQNDLPLEAGRELLGADKIIGVSTSSVELARAAEVGGADYIGFGPMYSGGLKNTAKGQGIERLAEVRAAVKLPIVAIGGITQATVPEVLAAGADAAAIITDVVKSPDISAKIRAILAIRTPR